MTEIIFADEPNFIEIGGFDEKSDIFNYKEFGNRLSNLLSSFNGSSGVFLLDGEWGSGKSFFIRQLSAHLRDKGASVILFDSFASDYVDDGFVALSAAMYNEAKSKLNSKSGVLRKYKKCAKSAATVLLPIAAQLAVKTISSGLISLEMVKEQRGEYAEVMNAMVDESWKIAENVISQKIEKLSDETATMGAFRDALEELANEVTRECQNSDTKYPLVFVVDELDRCRPGFALDLIEKIKHFFHVRNVCFVLVANLRQLEASVSGIYGINFDARSYLEKFFQYKILLPEYHKSSDKKAEIYLNYLVSKQKIAFESHDDTWSILKFILILVEKHNLQLRQIERIVTNLALVNRATNRRFLLISPIVAGLCVMRTVNPIAYELARKGRIDWRTVELFLTGGESEKYEVDIDKVIGAWEAGWWKFVAGGVLTKDIDSRKRAEVARYGIEEPKDILVVMSRFIDELAQN